MQRTQKTVHRAQYVYVLRECVSVCAIRKKPSTKSASESIMSFISHSNANNYCDTNALFSLRLFVDIWQSLGQYNKSNVIFQLELTSNLHFDHIINWTKKSTIIRICNYAKLKIELLLALAFSQFLLHKFEFISFDVVYCVVDQLHLCGHNRIILHRIYCKPVNQLYFGMLNNIMMVWSGVHRKCVSDWFWIVWCMCGIDTDEYNAYRMHH